MKKLLAAAALVLASATTSFAADMAVRTRTVERAYVAPVWSWTGFYGGVHGGYGWGSTSAAGFSGSTSLDGFFGGGQIGYNWQAPGSNWVFGLEADISASGIDQTAAGVLGGVALTATESVDYFGTVRGRIGYAWAQSLLYFTGGYAYGKDRFSVSAAVPGLGVVANSSSATGSGWVLGGGLETAINTNWTWGVEYQHISLGNHNFGGLNVSTDVDTVRLKLNYLFH